MVYLVCLSASCSNLMCQRTMRFKWYSLTIKNSSNNTLDDNMRSYPLLNDHKEVLTSRKPVIPIGRKKDFYSSSVNKTVI